MCIQIFMILISFFYIFCIFQVQVCRPWRHLGIAGQGIFAIKSLGTAIAGSTTSETNAGGPVRDVTNTTSTLHLIRPRDPKGKFRLGVRYFWIWLINGTDIHVIFDGKLLFWSWSAILTQICLVAEDTICRLCQCTTRTVLYVQV